METLELTPDELCAVVQGLRTSICERLYWMLSPHHPIRGEDFDDQTATLNHMVKAYSKAMMVARDSQAIAPEFKAYFMLSDDVWTMLDQLHRSMSWGDVPTHSHVSALGCALCDELLTAV
jgi:hypothetical protein